MVSAMRAPAAVGRNDPCPCGSGRKFKRCHGAKADRLEAAAPGRPAADPAHLAAWFRAAVDAFEQDDARTAAAHAQRILDLDPGYVDAINLLGIIACRLGHYRLSNELLGRAIALRPKEAQFVMNLGNARREEGRTEAAIASYRDALQLDPAQRDVHFNLGVAYAELDRTDAAIVEFTCYLGPDAEGHAAWRLAGTLRELEHFKTAVHFHAVAAAALPDDVEALHDHGGALADAGRVAEALPILALAAERAPDSPEMRNSLGNLYCDLGDLDTAQSHLEAAIALRPDYAEVHANLGRVFARSGRHEAACTALERACELEPGLHTAQWTLGQLLLLRGRYDQGWRRYEARLADRRTGSYSQRLKRDRWDGGPLDGRRIVLHAEQGIGDSIQFMRYAPMVTARGGRVTVLCQRPIQPLFSRLPQVEAAVALGDPLPEFDCYAPLMSLPFLFGTTLDSVPNAVPYLFADDGKVAHWRERLQALPGLKVGIAWAGNPEYRADARRSLHLDMLRSLATVPGVSFVSLQKGPAVAQVDAASGLLPLVRFDAELHDFSDTAALMMNLDIVISVDTAVAHLAGALGRPTWLLNRFDSDWRWLVDRSDSPWYPTLRVFRQSAPGNWAGVVADIAAALGPRAAGARNAVAG